MTKTQKHLSYEQDKEYEDKSRTDIRSVIASNHQKIQSLLRKRAKTFSDLHWIRYQLHKESEILMRIPYETKSRPDKSIWLDYTNIKNQEQTYDYIITPKILKREITRFEVIDIHRRLANGTKIIPGRYRISNGVFLMGTSIRPTDYDRIDSTMDDIVFELTNKNSDQDFLTRALEFHFKMYATQAFDDFNKRTARMVMNWYLMQNGCEPILFNKKSDYKNYAAALVARAHNDKHSYKRYMLNCLVRTQEDIISQLKKSKIL